MPYAVISCYRYWQSAVAASPSKAAKGYLLGSLLYAAIMFSLPLCIGLAVWALDLPVRHSTGGLTRFRIEGVSPGNGSKSSWMNAIRTIAVIQALIGVECAFHLVFGARRNPLGSCKTARAQGPHNPYRLCCCCCSRLRQAR